MGIEVKPPTIFEEVANTEAYWGAQTSRWRIAACVAIFFLLVEAILSTACR